ncbi:MAG: hypothetical protein ACREOO_15440 [bacterium]
MHKGEGYSAGGKARFGLESCRAFSPGKPKNYFQRKRLVVVMSPERSSSLYEMSESNRLTHRGLRKEENSFSVAGPGSELALSLAQDY